MAVDHERRYRALAWPFNWLRRRGDGKSRLSNHGESCSVQRANLARIMYSMVGLVCARPGPPGLG